MNACCYRWRFGAYSVKKTGEASSFCGPDVIKFCPQCGGKLEEEEKPDSESKKG